MAEELKQLIDKIQSEGVQAAEQKAKGIENEARKRAEAIVKQAKEKAEGIISDAKAETTKMQASGEVALKQAGRDLIIALKGEINDLLKRLVVIKAGEALAPEKLADIIGELVKGHAAKGAAKDIFMLLSEKDLKVLESSFKAEVKAAAAKGVILRSSDSIRAGFSISYDAGESRFDFTDESLAEYLGIYLKPMLAELLKEAGTGKKK